MKLITSYCIGIFLTCFLSSSYVIPVKIYINKNEPDQFNLNKIIVNERVDISSKKLNTAKHNQSKLKEKISFRILQHHYKKVFRNHSIDENESNEKSKKFNFGAFLMGLIFSVVGVALIYLLSKDKVDRQSSWIGFGFSMVLILILISLGASLFSFVSFDFPI